MWIGIHKIRVGSKQLAKLDRHKVEAHRIAFEEGGSVVPIDVVDLGDGTYNICGNGRHRYFGALEAGVTEIDCNVLNS